MQDISRDELSIINAGDVTVVNNTEADSICSTFMCKIQNASTPTSSDMNSTKHLNNKMNELAPPVSVKLEDINTNDLFPLSSSSWQQYQINDLVDQRSFPSCNSSFERNSTKLLLQGSDDPLISHGANSVLSDDEHPTDFAKNLNTHEHSVFENIVKKTRQERQKSYLNRQITSERPVKSGCSNLTKQQLKVKAGLISARHQQQQQNQNVTTSLNISATISTPDQQFQLQKNKSKKRTTVKLRFHHQALPPEYLSHYEATQGQPRVCKTQPSHKTPNQRSSAKSTNNYQRQNQHRNSNENVRSWLQKIAEIQRTANASKESASPTQNPIGKPQCGEIYESQNSSNRTHTDANNNYQMQKEFETQNICGPLNSVPQDDYLLTANNNCQSSKRSHYTDLPYMGEITLENCKPRRGRKPKKVDICHLIYKNYGTILPKKTKPENIFNSTSTTLNTQDNFVKKEANEQPLNLCLRDQQNDSYSISSGEELSESNSTCPTPVSNAPNNVGDSMSANNLKTSPKNIDMQNEERELLRANQSNLPVSEETVIHPIAMCYKKLLESGVLQHNANGRFKTIEKDNQLTFKIPIPNGLLLAQELEKSTTSPVELSPDPRSRPPSNPTENSLPAVMSLSGNQQLIMPQKRKRSAIFIPPMNIENLNNPATEVSICKFKFTGGAKPSLEEKKMISVDAGGNYRYFSGTGDKSSRGYEYFPRKSLQHTAGLIPGVNCTGQKIFINITPTSNAISNSFLEMPDSASPSVVFSNRSASVNGDSISPFEANNNNKPLCGTT